MELSVSEGLQSGVNIGNVATVSALARRKAFTRRVSRRLRDRAKADGSQREVIADRVAAIADPLWVND